MSSHNKKPNHKTKSSATRQRGRWPRLMTVAFFSICLSLFGFAGAAQADYTLTLKIADGPDENACLVDDGTGTTQYGPSASQDEYTIPIPEGNTVTLTALPDASSGWYFNMFDVDLISTENSSSFVMNEDKYIQVKFNSGGHQVTLSNPGTGSGTIRWGINGWPWWPDQHLDPGQSVVIGVGNGDYIYFDDGAPRGPDAGSVNDGWTGVISQSGYWFLGNITGDRSVTVTFTNHVPTANDDSYSTSEETDLSPLFFTGVLSNDSDPQGDMLEAYKVGDPSNGTLTLNPDGSFTYTPNGNFYGTDTFTYQAYDGTYYSNTATVTITVNNTNDNPDAVDDGPIVVVEDSGANAIDVLANDTYLPDPVETLLITVVTQGSDGAVAITGGGTGLTYTPNADFEGPDSFTYTIEDGNGGTDTATVNITVTGLNDAPTANDDTGTVAEGGTLNEPAIGVLGNDTDVDVPADTLTVNAVNGSGANVGNPIATPNGTVTLNADGSYTYVHDGSENLTDSFTYTVSDGTDTSAPATVTITMTPVNDNDPVANDDVTDAVNEGAVVTTVDGGQTSLLHDDTDVDLPNDTLTVNTIPVVAPTYGVLVLNGDGTFSYTHDGSENFSDSFTYEVSDANGGLTDTATVTITITPVDDAHLLQVKVFDGKDVNSITVDWPTGSRTCWNDIDCLGVNGIPIQDGTQVTLTPHANATPPNLWAFNDWKKDGSGNDNPYVIILDMDKQIDGHFKELGYRLTINATGTGTGCVTASIGSDWLMGGGTACTFPAYFAYGDIDIETLTPAADAGSVFYEWTGDGSGSPVRTVDMNAADRSVTVEFRKLWDLTVTTSGGTGSESVGLAPAPLSSVGNVHTYYANTIVTLTANPDTTTPGYSVLKQWTGDASGSANPTTVSMTGDKSVDAGFVAAYRLRMLAPDGTGSGAVTPPPGDYFYETGTVASITATPSGVPAPGSAFVQWNENPAGYITDPNAANTTVNMNGDVEINATFGQNYEISISDASVAEGGIAKFGVTVTPVVASGDTVTVNYDSTGLTATEGTDFTSVDAGSLTFTDASLNPQTIDVTTTADAGVEGNETFTVDLSNPSANVVVIDNQADGTITNDDNYGISINDASAEEGNQVSFTITLDAARSMDVDITITTTDGTATLADSDYTDTSGVATIPAGPVNQTMILLVDTIEDPKLEPDETFTVTLSSVDPNATFTDDTGEGTILNDDYDVSFAPASVSVSEEEGNDLVFTLTLDRVATADVTVSYTVAPVAPTTAADYTDVTLGSVTIASGSQTADITVNATEDGVVEGDEDFTVTLDSVDTGNGTITGTNPATGTMLNDDYDVSVAPASVAVSAEEGNDLVFTLTLDRVAAADVTVLYTVAPVAPTTAADYTDVTGGSVTIPSGSQTADITVNATEDGVKEADEDFTVTLDSVDTGNATITGANPATGTILNDDYDVSFDNAAIVVAEDAGNAVFTVSLDRVITGPETVTVDYTTANGTADQPGDYTATNGTLAFNSGTGASLPISVPIVDDGIVELSEDFSVQLTVTSVNGAIPGSDTATGTITNNDAYTVSISNVSKSTVQEGTDTDVTFTVTLANMDPVKGVVGMAQVDVATVDGTAVDGDDFTGGSNTLIFSGTDDAFDVMVPIKDDVYREGDENFQFDLSNPVSCTIAGTDPETVTIQDDGTDVYNVSIDSPAPVTEAPSKKITFTVTLANVDPTNGVIGSVNVDYETNDASAVAGSDYTAIPTTTMTFNPGDGPTKTFDVTVLQDTLVENQEIFQVLLSAFDGGGTTGGPGTGRINDDLDTYSVSVDSPPAVVEAGGATITFTVTLSNVDPLNGVSGAVHVDYATKDGSAVGGDDYTVIPITTMTFNNGDLPSKSFDVTVLQDTLVENPETFDIVLSNFDGGGATGAAGKGTINDDGDTYGIFVDDQTVAEGGTATFTVSLDQAPLSSHSVTVDYATSDGTAVDTQDYTATSGSFTYTSGQTTKTFIVPVIDDPQVEFAENFFVDLSNASINATILDAQGEGTIPVDDKYQVSIDDVTVGEPGGNIIPGPVSTTTVTFKVTLDQLAIDGAPLTVDFATADASAVAGGAGSGDYDAILGTLSFDGVDTQTITVTVNNDGELDPAEVFVVNLTNANPAPLMDLVDNRGECTITDDDYTLTVSNPLSGEGTVDVSVGSVSGLGGADDLVLAPGASVDFIYQAGDVVTLSDEKEATLPDPGSRFKGYSANPVTITGTESVTANFVQLYRLTPVAVVHGTMTPDTPQIVEHGESLGFTAASALPDYTVVKAVLVDGVSVNGATAPPAPALNATTYTFTNVTANHDIGATFTDYGDTCSTAQPVCCPPDVSVLNAEINPAGDWDYVKVVTPLSGTLKIYTSGTTDTYGYLLDTNCNPDAPITRNDDKDQHNTNFYIEERNMPAGTYYVAVKHWERWPWFPVGTGAYTLHVEFNSDDHGSDPNSATLVSCNSATTGNLETGGNEDYFAVDLSGDGVFTVYTTGTTDTVGTLIDATPAILTQDNNSGTDSNFLIQRTLPAGMYYVAVSHNDGVGGTGAYTLNVDCELTHSIWATAGFGGSISPEGTVSVQEGQSQTFTITPDGSNTVYDVEVDGKSVGAVTTYTFTNVQKNHTIVAYFQLPPGICLDISDTPLDARFQAAPANLMFVLDDSGSMDWTFLTPDREGQFYIGSSRYRYVFDNPGDNLYGNVLSRGWPRRHWKSQWYEYNRIYYNPDVTYDPWPTLSDAHGDFPRSHPWHASPTFNLSLSYQTVDTGAAGDLTIVVDDEDPSPYFEKGPNVSQMTINDRGDTRFSKTASNGGEWRSSTNNEAYNDEYYYSRRVGDYTATWTPNFPADGEYDVYARWVDSSNRSQNVPYTITYSDGVGGTLTDTVEVNQRVNGGKWVKLGTYFFSAGAGDVTLSYHVSSTSNDRVCADAIRFTPTGASWDWATHGDAYNNHYWWTPTNGDYWARWTPDLPVAGDWEVQVRWYGNNERSTGDAADKVKYLITHAGGTTEYVPHPSQRKNSGIWVSLGTYTFNAGTGGNVTLTHTRTGSTDTVCADAVRFIPPIPLTIDIKRAHYYTWDDANGDTVIDPGEVWMVNIDGSIKYYQFTDADGDDVVDTGELMPVTDILLVPDSVKTGRTYVEERQNFANWYSFYRRRELTATAAVSKVVAEMRGVNIGYYSINGRLKQPVLPVKLGVNDQTPTLLNTLYSMVLKSASTPLRRGLRSVGRYFHADDGDSGGLGNSPYLTAAEGGECQQAFAIVMTDGYWNGGSPNLGNTDGDNNTDWDGNPYADNYYNTLADVAMYFYERDLSSSLDDIVPVNPEDQATHQHMVTYTVAFGLEGTLNPDDYDFVNTFPTWPEPDGDANATKIDDLYHAAKNGRGQYLSAKNPQDLIDQMLAIIYNIQSRIGSSSSVAVNGDELYDTIGSDVRMFQGTYSSDGWVGDVKSYAIDLVTGEVLIQTPLWSAAEQLEIQNWDSGRQIATFDGVTGRAFRFDSLTDELKDLLDVNWTTDDTNARAILNYVRGDTSNEQQNGGAFRNRFQKLGDIVHASPLHNNGILYTGANDGMLHAFDAATGNELFAYVPKLVFENLKELKDPLYTHRYYVDLTPDVEDIYVPAGGAYADGVDNDSDGDTDEADEMKVKTVLVGGLSKGGHGYYALDVTDFDGSTVFTEGTVASRVMWEYPNPRVMNVTEGSCAGEEGPVIITTAVPHGLSVGDTVEIAGVHDEANGTWTVALVSSATQFRLNKNCDEAEGSFYSGSSGTASEIEPDWADMGFSYSKPAIVNSQAGYIVMFGNGYNSDTGIAKLIILDLLTGELVRSIDTQKGGCNGLSSPTPVDADFDGLVDYVYAGDLNGNLWKFDLTDASASNWDVAYKSAPYTGGAGTDPEPLFQARSPAGVPQPITSKPDVMDWCTTHGYMVTFGTGKWLGDFDYANTTTQTLYGIWDYGDDEDDSEYLGVIDRGATPQLSNQLDSVTLLEQTVLPCDPNIATCDGDFWVFYDKQLRILTDNMASIINPWGTTSEYNGGADCGDGEGIIDCEPNNIGANPDPVKLAGWYFDLPLSGERSVSDALIREGRVVFVPYVPEASPCGAGGDSIVMEVDACTGGQTTRPQFDINEDGIIDENDFVNIGTADDPVLVAPSGMKAAGKLQPPAILRVPDTDKERKYFSSSRGKIVTVDEKAVVLGITYWQEFE